MPRTMTTAVSNAAKAQAGKFVHLVYLGFTNVTTGAAEPRRLTTGDIHVTADVGDGSGSVIWTAYGGKLDFEPIPESGDLKAAGASMTFPAVERTLIADALAKYYFGRTCAIYHAEMSGASVIATPICFWSGSMSGGWEIDDSRDDSATTTLKLRAVPELALMDVVRGLQTNLNSYRSLFPEYATDTFFDVVPSNARKQEPWGKRATEAS